MPACEHAKRPLRVLFFYDVPGWAWWNKIRHLKRHASPDLDIDMLPAGEPFDHEAYDFVVIFEHFFLRHLTQVPGRKILVGSCCPRTLEPLLEALPGSGARAAFLNNLAGYEAAKACYRAYYCPNGVDEELFYPAARPVSEFSVCWVGNSGSVGSKGLDLIEEACAKAKAPLIALDQKERIGKGEVLTQEALREDLYHRAAAYVCASEVEGTPNPCLEAMACGLPVVTTRVGNMPELVRPGHNGLFADRTVESLAAALAGLAAMDWRTMGQNARASIVQGWTWKAQAARYTKMFQELAAERP